VPPPRTRAHTARDTLEELLHYGVPQDGPDLGFLSPEVLHVRQGSCTGYAVQQWPTRPW
jgi:hypothetical protein